MSDEPAYSRGSVLRALFAEHHHPLLHLDPPDYRGTQLADEARRAAMNAALVDMRIEKERATASDDRLRALNHAYQAERSIADLCRRLEELRTIPVN